MQPYSNRYSYNYNRSIWTGGTFCTKWWYKMYQVGSLLGTKCTKLEFPGSELGTKCSELEARTNRSEFRKSVTHPYECSNSHLFLARSPPRCCPLCLTIEVSEFQSDFC